MKQDPDVQANFIVIGPGKSGTSWVYELLLAHPDVCVSSAKETLFFEDGFHSGVAWYHSFYKHWQGEPRVGEVSNTYIFSALAARRMKAYNPALKLISTLRNPIERAFSHYLFLLRNGEMVSSFEDATRQQPHLIERGLYFKHLSAYLEHFDRENLLCLLFDDLKEDAEAYAEQLFQFLDCGPLDDQDLFTKKVLPASKARNKWVARSVKRSALAVREMGFPDLITKVKASPLTRLLYKPFAPGERPDMKPQTREHLKTYYQDDIEQLSTLLRRDLTEMWLK